MKNIYTHLKRLKQEFLSTISTPCIVISGVLVMTDKREGLTKLIEVDTISTQNSHLMRYRGIIHQEMYTQNH